MLLLSLGLPPPGRASKLVRTTVGTVHGTLQNEMAVFAGIPYAKPPVGRRRFLPPEPAERAKRGGPTLDATAFKPDCLQSVLANEFAPSSQDEDCLYLNIWVPMPRPEASGASLGRLFAEATLRPVLVWIHGGAFRSGGTSMPCYNGSALARRADALVVSVNYRLGPFGFLVSARDGLVGNAGVSDQLLALRWLADNVRAFGGDPRAVTLLGESAGAMSVGLHLTDPEARPLFRAAAIMSAPLSYRYRTLALADVLSRSFLDSLGCSGAGALACAQSAHSLDLLAAAERVGLPRHVSDFLWWAPVAPLRWGEGGAEQAARAVRPAGGGATGGAAATSGEQEPLDVRRLGPRRPLSLLEAIGGSAAAGSLRAIRAVPSAASAAKAPRPRPPLRPRRDGQRLRQRALRLVLAAGRLLVAAAVGLATPRPSASASASARPRPQAHGGAEPPPYCGEAPGPVAIADVPLLLGSTADEGAFFLALGGLGPGRLHLSRAALWATLGLLFRLGSRGVLRVYGPLAERAAEGEGAKGEAGERAAQRQGHTAQRGRGPDYSPVLAAVLTDYMFRCPARRLATALHSAPRSSRTFLYRFGQASNHTPVGGCKGRACHTMELPFLFEQPEPPLLFSKDEAALARAMGGAWAAFAKAGAPGVFGASAAAPGVVWQPWSVEGEETLEIRWPPVLTGGALAPVCDLACDFWDSTGYAF